jgi:hypothetical protein
MRLINRPSNHSLSDTHPLKHIQLFLFLRVNTSAQHRGWRLPRGERGCLLVSS